MFSTPLQPIDFTSINGNLFGLLDQIYKRIEDGETVVEIAVESEASALEIENRLNYVSDRRGLAFGFSLTETRPNVYRILLEEFEPEEE